MRKRFPASLLQIHYHDRLGGVRQVMSEYSTTFRRIAGIDAPNYWLCSRSGEWEYATSTPIALPEADYHTFRTRQSYQRWVERLAGRLLQLLFTLPLQFPAVIIGHNLNLGKNPALAAAFAHCARTLGGDGGRYRFFLMMHDFAEAGRIDLLSILRRITEQGVDIYRELYASEAPVHYIVPDRFSARLSGLKESSITILPHPVRKTTSLSKDISADAVRDELRLLALRDGFHFDPDRRLYCYPSRMIYRKNILEALLIATVLLEGSLVTGACGLARADRRRVEVARHIARKNRLSFVIDPSRMPLFGTAVSKTGNMNPFILLYHSADVVITTSIAEGFGYSLIEPWLYGKPVIGRRPAGASLLPGMHRIPFYECLPVPASWVSIQECYERFAATCNLTFGKRYVSMRSFTALFVKNGTVDFGILSDRQQDSIIRRVLRSDRDRSDLLALLERPLPGWPGNGCITRSAGEEIERIAAIISRWSDRRFGPSFVNCLSRRPFPASSAIWYRRIAAYYRKPDNFFPLGAVPRSQ